MGLHSPPNIYAHSLKMQGELPSAYIVALKLLMTLLHRPRLSECAAQVCTDGIWMRLGMEWWKNIRLVSGAHRQDYSTLDPVGCEAVTLTF